MKEKLKSYEFWVSIVSAVMVVLQSISLKFDFQEIVMGFLGVLAVAGIVKKKDPPTDDTFDGNSTEDTDLTDSSQEEDKL